jgi:transcriptional regulator with XRE-family HTH domain
MQTVRERFDRSGLTLQALGEQMGYPSQSARQSASQFLQTGDPQISMLRRFAEAMGVSLATLLK